MAKLRRSPEKRLHTVSFLEMSEWDEDEALDRIRKYECQIASRPISLESYLAHVSVDGEGTPSPCGIILEDGFGECARDMEGNPLVVIYGNFECASEAAIDQMCFLIHRLQRYIHATQLPYCSYVFDMKPRAGRHAIGKQWELSFLKFISLCPQSFTLYICGAPPSAAKAFGMIPKSVLGNIKISEDYSILDGVVDPSNMLPSWHPSGTFDFDLHKYRQYLSNSFET